MFGSFSSGWGFRLRGLGLNWGRSLALDGLRRSGLAPFVLGEDDISFMAVHPGDLEGFLQGVYLDNLVIFLPHGDGLARFWHRLADGVVGVVLVGEAAEQPVADAGDLGRIERNPCSLAILMETGAKFLRYDEQQSSRPQQPRPPIILVS